MDSELYMLCSANAEEFFAVTSDEDFSCVYYINPVQNTCIPEMSIQAPILKSPAISPCFGAANN